MELYARVRRAVHVEGRSQREVAREFGLARKTVRKMLEYPAPPGYQRQKPVRRPKLGPWQGAIDAILEEDKSRPRRQRHSAKRIFERLREEHGYTGGYTIVKDYVRQAKIGAREMFVPLSHAPGEAQADFGEALVVVAGVECEAHYFAFDLPHSDDCFVTAFPAETTEAFLEGHVRAFAYFGGVPRRILYDNTRLAVARILGDGERQKTRAFSELQSHYLFAEKFGRPAKGNDKGKVEGPGWLCAAQLHGSDSTRIELGGAEPASGSCLPEATAAPVARAQGDHRGTLRARSHSTSAVACCAL